MIMLLNARASFIALGREFNYAQRASVEEKRATVKMMTVSKSDDEMREWMREERFFSCYGGSIQLSADT